LSFFDSEPNRATGASKRDVSAAGYRRLAEFRYRIRQFLHFSEEAVHSYHIEPQRHQLLLAIKDCLWESDPRSQPCPRDFEPLRVVVHRMAESGLTRLLVLDPQGERKLVGMISLNDFLRARTRNLAEEHKRERTLRIRMPFDTYKTL
jgi:hypothetical protein